MWCCFKVRNGHNCHIYYGNQTMIFFSLVALGLLGYRHLVIPVWSHRDHCFVTSHQRTLQWNLFVILRWPSFDDSTMKSPWPLICDETPGDVEMKSHLDLSQSNGPGDFREESWNVGDPRATEYLHVDMTWDSSKCNRHADFTVESTNDGHMRVKVISQKSH